MINLCNFVFQFSYEALFRAARRAAASLAATDTDTLDRTLRRCADALRRDSERLMEANAVDLDRILKSWGYLPRQTATVWWRVESPDGSVSDISEYRSINLTTLAMDAVDIVLDAPAENALIAVNDVEQVTFSWEPVPNADIYSLEFSLTENGEPIGRVKDGDAIIFFNLS